MITQPPELLFGHYIVPFSSVIYCYYCNQLTICWKSIEHFCIIYIDSSFIFEYILSPSDPTERSTLDHFDLCFGEHDFIYMKQFSFHFKDSLSCILIGLVTTLSFLIPLSFTRLTSLCITLSVYILYNRNYLVMFVL